MKDKNNTEIIEIPQTVSKIGENSVYEGTLKFQTSISILGKFKGSIIGGELLVVYPGAVVEGNIIADYLLVVGSIHGDIRARRGVYFFKDAVVRGSVTSAVIRMQSGVDFDGKCNLSIKEEVDIFSLSRETFYATIFDKLLHELDDVQQKTENRTNINAK